jgi:hypothetical protein
MQFSGNSLICISNGIVVPRHVPELAAAALGNYLLHKAGGEAEIRRMLVEDIRAALAENRLAHATELLMALRNFMSEHPGAAGYLDNCSDQLAAAVR